MTQSPTSESVLAGKGIVVTGGARGIGRALAIRFAQEGAGVVVADSGGEVEVSGGGSSGPAAEVVNTIRSAGGKAISCPVDISTIEGAERCVRLAVEQFGQLYAMVCCAGIVTHREIQDMPVREWDDVIRVHLRGHFASTRAAARAMIPQGFGRVLYFSSLSALTGPLNQPSYSAAKAGILGLLTSSARGLGRFGITVNCILPGAATRMTDLSYQGRVTGEIDRTLPSALAEGTWRDPMNITSLPVFLLTPDGDRINGQAFAVVGYQVTEIVPARYGKSIRSDRPWDLAELATEFTDTFGSDFAPNDLPWPPP